MTRASLRHTMNHRDLLDLFRSSHQRCSVKKGVLKTFANFTGKHLCWSLFLITLLVFRPATLLKRYRSSHQRCSIKRAVLKNFAIFTGKHLCRSRFFQKETPTLVFFCEYCEIFKNTYFEKHLRTTASEDTPTLMLSYEIWEIFRNTYFEEHLRKTASNCFTSKYYNNEWWWVWTRRDLDRAHFNQMQLHNLQVS